MLENLPSLIEHGYRRRKFFNALWCGLLGLAAFIALTALFIVFAYVLMKGFPALNWDFFTKLPAPVGEQGGGMANSLLGTALLVCMASLVGIPWGIDGSGKFATAVRFAVDMLSSVPSIVVGLFIYTLVVAPMGHFSAHAGSLALALLMVPVVARSTEEILRMVPVHIREAGLALGLPRWKVTTRIVLRGMVTGLTTGVILAIARVAGETAPLLFTALNNRFWSTGLSQPISSLPVQIFTYATSPYEDWHRQAWAGALVLVMFVFAINLTTRLVLSPVRSKGEGR
jgi:phosphate transport system permease protein